MALRFHDTLTRSLRDFEPLVPGHVGFYACGPTVYQRPHIGNYRTFLFYDLVHRWLEWKGLEVRFVMNLTDVDDRIIDRAAAAGVSVRDYTDPHVRGFLEELDLLGIRPADDYPRATESTDSMARLVERLLERGHAYVADDGSIFFDISSFPDYGKLSRIPLDEVRTGERVADDRYEKADARDFALWKAPKPADAEVGAVLAVPVAVLVGLAFSMPLAAWAARTENEASFVAIFRFGILPMFLFSGTFVPAESYPAVLRWLIELSLVGSSSRITCTASSCGPS